MSVWTSREPLLLASKSVSRQELLRAAAIPFEAIPAEIDERGAQAGLPSASPAGIASALARDKALWVATRHQGRLVLGADQTLALGERMFNKPADRAQAAEQLRALAGRMHELHSAFALARDGRVLHQTVATARMSMRPLSDDAIARYLDLAGDRVTSSVGAYQLEGLGIHLFSAVEGDHFTILGLPLLPLLASLRKLGLIAI